MDAIINEREREEEMMSKMVKRGQREFIKGQRWSNQV